MAVRPYVFAPFPLLRSQDGLPAGAWLERLINAGMMPVTFGDVVQTKDGFSILSGDTIVYELALMTRAERSVYALEVEGVLDPDGKLMPVFRRQDMAGLKVLGGEKDATGGITFKLSEALRTASRAPRYRWSPARAQPSS